jgi:hypothetical protein
LDNGCHRHLHLPRKRVLRLDPHARPQHQGPHRPRRNSSDKARASASTATSSSASLDRKPPQGRDHLSVKLEDPSFPAPIYATLAEVDGEDGVQLIWSLLSDGNLGLGQPTGLALAKASALATSDL